jgi:hypothetical protein
VSSFSSPATAVSSAPAVARGIDIATAEIAYVDASNGGVYHSRLIGNFWTTPTLVVMPSSFVAITSGP